MAKQKEVSTQVVIAALEKKANPLTKQLNAIKITNQHEYNAASDKLKKLKDFAKVAEKEEKAMREPLNLALKRISEHFKPFQKKADLIEKAVKEEMVKFIEGLEAKQRALEKSFDKREIKKISTFTKKTQELQVNSDTSSVRKVWTSEVTDITKVPREYLMVDMNLVNAAHKEGKEVPGTRYYQKKSIAV